MEIAREPVLKPIAIADLRPTQITVGMREVLERRRRWRALKKKKLNFLETHMIPVILGPKGRHYITDHLWRAIGDICDLYKLPDCANFFKAARYAYT